MLAEPNCWTRHCKYWIGVKSDGEDEENERSVCQAFPEGIPSEITEGDNLHLTPLPDQSNDIVYAEAEEWPLP
jgi:hypothetical protein